MPEIAQGACDRRSDHQRPYEDATARASTSVSAGTSVQTIEADGPSICRARWRVSSGESLPEIALTAWLEMLGSRNARPFRTA
jgi:hypothetical protein